MTVEEIKDKYTGQAADSYESARSDSEKWQLEQRAVEMYLDRIAEELGNGFSVLDVPIGTGRFIPKYGDVSATVTGMDISSDMIEQAREKSSAPHVTFEEADVMEAEGVEADVVVSTRFINHLSKQEAAEVIQKFSSFANQYVIMDIRVYPGSRFSLKRVY